MMDGATNLKLEIYIIKQNNINVNKKYILEVEKAKNPIRVDYDDYHNV